MSSSRRNGSVSRAAETASKTRLHMDRNPQHSRITDPSNPAGRRKEIDNVMKRARQASPGSWDRKLLEVEEKDPNRWRHTGYKQLYLDGSKSPSPRRSRSPVGLSRRSRSPVGLSRRSRSPKGLSRRSRSPIGLGRRSRSPIGLGRRSRSPVGLGRRSRSPIGLSRRSRSPVGLGRRSRSPPPRRSRSARRSPRRSPPRRSRSRSRPARPAARPPRARPPSPPHPPQPTRPKQSSPSGSSTGSCSDESCSVCSAKNKKLKVPPKPSAVPSASTAKRPTAKPRPPPGVVPTKELLKARDATKRSREEKVLEWQRSQLPRSVPLVAVKREGARTPPRPRPLSPAALTAALTPRGPERAASEDGEQSNRLTLSERFGKMAQWSLARSSRVNMRITRRDKGPNGLHVRIEPTDLEPSLSPAPVGSYPEALLAAAPGGLPSWDDVTVRYDYYKKRGYLRGLTLGDYVKWEEWWYKYQEWLKRERAFERWAEGDLVPPRRERRRRAGRHRRS